MTAAEGGGGGDGRPNGLEIVTIGTLYSGPWDKKYWSSSRGKVRYPYPVGYHARRTYNGATYKLEISEGPKGPLFMIASPDGDSSSAHTPDVAWDKFQKKGCQQVKIWHQKGFLGMANGIEFFGFKSPSVQRLLRELQLDVNEIAEQSVLPSSQNNDIARGEHNDQLQRACKSPDVVVPDMERPLVTGKRSKRTNTKAFTPSNVTRLKRPRRGRPASSAEVVCYSVNENHEQQSSLSPSTFGSTEEPEKCKLISTTLPLISISEDENCQLSAVNGLTLQSRDDSNGQKDEMLTTLEEGKLADSEIHACIYAVNGLNIQGNIIDRSSDSNLRTSANGKHRHECIQDSTLCVPGNDLCAPDTFNSLEEHVPNELVTSTRLDEEKLIASETCISERLVTESHPGDDLDTRLTSPCIDKKEFIVADTFMSEAVLSESHMENEVASGCSNGCSEKFDSDSVGQEIDKSMMTLLLPQAIPLLKKASKKKRKSNAMVHNFVSSTKTREENKATSGVHSPRIEHTKAVVLDSLENKQCEVGRQLVLLADYADCEKSSDGKDGRPPHSCDDLVNGDVRNSDMGIFVQTAECITNVGSPTETGSQNTIPGNRKVYTRRKTTSKATNNGALLSERTTCRTYEGGCDAGSMPGSEALNASPSVGALEDRTSTVRQLHTLQVEEITMSCRPKFDDLPICVSTEGEHGLNMLQTLAPVSDETQTDCKDRLVEQSALVDSHGSVRSQTNEVVMESSSGKQVQANADLNSFELDLNIEGIAELVGCYIHPLPVLHLWLSSQENEIYICALCGLQNKDRTLFLYKLARTGCPSFVGHTTVSWPPAVHIFGNVPPERTRFQLTPYGELLVLHGSIKVPCCREGRVDCLCSTCQADSRSSSSVKILRVKLGYVSVLLKLRTDEAIECILVCRPNHLVAAVESGRLHLWTVDTTWSTLEDQYTISTKGYYSPRIVELKSIPQSASLVVGHDGFEEFTLWDISKRVFIARFSGPGTSIYAFHPISRFTWPKGEAHHAHLSSSYNLEEHVKRMMEATKLSFTESSPQMDGEDIAIWLLVATNPSNHPTDPLGCWRLALMARNTLILGTTLDPGAAAVATSGGNGIFGTRDGAVYMWDLSTGNRLGTLHHFKDGSVSCVATDDSRGRLGIIAVGSQTGQLLVCRHL